MEAFIQVNGFVLPILRELVRISYTHRPYILVGSIVIAFFCAVFLLSSKEGNLLAGRWIEYVGWAFAGFSVQYVFRFIGWMIPDSERAFPWLARISCDFLASACSGANNLFLLAAACVLLTRKRPFMHRGNFVAIVLTTATLSVLANSYFVENGFALPATLLRLPDSTLSAFCLGLFGYATMRNFISRHRQYWAVGALTIGIVYGGIQLVYAGNPYLAKLRDTEIRDILKRARYDPKPTDPVQYLDSAVFGAALPLKFLLFVPTSYLFFTLIVAAHDFRKVLREVTETNKSFLAADGIVQAIGQSISADVVELFIKLPGTQQQRVWPLAWEREPKESRQEPQPLALANGHERAQNTDPLLKRVMETGKDFVRPSGNSSQGSNSFDGDAHLSPRFLIMLAVKFHGGVIGCLKASFNQPRTLNYSVLQQLRSLADLLAPAVQDYRALASLDQISYRVARLQVEDPRVRKVRTGGEEEKSEMPTTDLQEAIRNVADILDDVLSPLASELLVEIGFRSDRVLTGDRRFHRSLEGQEASYESDDQPTTINHPDTGRVKEYHAQLAITPREGCFDTFPMGNLILVLPDERDAVNRPSLGSYDLHRRAIASHAADALLDVVRDYFAHEVKDLSVRLNAEGLTEEAWFCEIQRTAQGSGCFGERLRKAATRKYFGAMLAPKQSSIALMKKIERNWNPNHYPASSIPIR